jgi:hypothetical protein
MKRYPSEHKEVVSHLLDGKFVIYPSPLFMAGQQLEDDYREFFKESYGFDFVLDSELMYLTSNDVMEKRTRDFTLFLAVLCRELDYSGKNFRDTIELGTFDCAETEELLRHSPKWEILEKTTVADFEGFIDVWHKRNVLKRSGESFKFTKAIKVFFEFAVNVANAKLRESPASP